jgi:alpha-D-xyloside xylohydrolase
MQINNESVHFGTPMMRPVALQFPADPVVKANLSSTEAEFLLGPDWLIAPVTAENATSWPIYLPVLPEGDTKASWIYWWNQTSFAGGQWLNIDVTNIGDFPLFFRRPK